MARANGKDRGLFQRKGDTKTWWIRWACPYGHEHMEKCGTKSFARQMYAQRKTQVKMHRFCLQAEREKRKRTDEAKFDLVAARYLEWAKQHWPRSIGYRQTALKHLTPFFGNTPLSDITRADVEKFIQQRLDSDAAPASVNRCRAVLSQIFGKAQDWGLVSHNPAFRTTYLKENNIAPRPLTPEEESALFAVLPERIKPVVTLALHTGLRMGELRAQRWDDIDIVDRSLIVTQPKSGQREALPLNDTARTLLASLPQTSDVIFPAMPVSLSRSFTGWAKKAGLPADVTFHCLRDTYISRLAPHCAGPTLMRLARHRSFATTQRYLRVDEPHLREAVEQISANSQAQS